MQLLIRPAELFDMPQLRAIEQAMFLDGWSESSIKNELLKPQTMEWVLEHNDEIAGELLMSVLFDVCEISRLAILPHHRRLGLASNLLGFGLQRAQAAGAEVARLEVRIDNEPAIALYLAHGFVQDGVRKGYYLDGLDAILMSKRLEL